ncbi:MAG: hypothetical protein AAFQ10_06250 [Pseudomonadota bacterium]
MRISNAFYWVGLIGFLLAALLSIPPVLTNTLAALGLTNLRGIFDIVLLPLLTLFAVLYLVGLRGRKMRG